MSLWVWWEWMVLDEIETARYSSSRRGTPQQLVEQKPTRRGTEDDGCGPDSLTPSFPLYMSLIVLPAVSAGYFSKRRCKMVFK